MYYEGVTIKETQDHDGDLRFVGLHRDTLSKRVRLSWVEGHPECITVLSYLELSRTGIL